MPGLTGHLLFISLLIAHCRPLEPRTWNLEPRASLLVTFFHRNLQLFQLAPKGGAADAETLADFGAVALADAEGMQGARVKTWSRIQQAGAVCGADHRAFRHGGPL